MTTNEIVESYQTAISNRTEAAQEQCDRRFLLDALERRLKLAEAELLLNGAGEGKNAEERSARLLLAVSESEECQALRTAIEAERQAIGAAERQMAEATETCRLLRLQLALCAPDAVRELVA